MRALRPRDFPPAAPPETNGRAPNPDPYPYIFVHRPDVFRQFRLGAALGILTPPITADTGEPLMRIHAIQTGTVRIKTAQVEGRGHGLRRRLAIFADSNWTGWLPTYAWAIEHREGVIVVDTGQGAHLLENVRSYHPYLRWEVAFRVEREEEIGPQLRALGIGQRDVKKVILTHLHMDHDGGLAHFPNSVIF